VKPTGWLAALVLFLHLPIPFYWFVVHPFSKLWRNRRTAAYVTGLICSWPPVTAGLVIFHERLFRHDWPPAAALIAGVALIIFEGWIFWRVHRDLGTGRLVGQTELSGGGNLQTQGIYAHIRHPRYAGSFLAIVGACLLGGTLVMWIIALIWLTSMLIAIGAEERELKLRFGLAYEEYARNVPRFLPLRVKLK
jgi:protein-S-isoprenylcysteine O-methyltransferase Ste14